MTAELMDIVGGAEALEGITY
ncbi:MAG: hypothetical protein MZV70_50435 [Desulfobacterales bacterium]|nr:hypothetical protein [Desulfobacterales bacterium]